MVMQTASLKFGKIGWLVGWAVVGVERWETGNNWMFILINRNLRKGVYKYRLLESATLNLENLHQSSCAPIGSCLINFSDTCDAF
jgi:hypothetical protein